MSTDDGGNQEAQSPPGEPIEAAAERPLRRHNHVTAYNL